MNTYNNVIDQKNIFSDSTGEFGFSELVGKLINIFDNEIKKIAKEVGAKEQFYPVLLSKKALKKTGYLKRTSGECIFCNGIKATGDNSEYVLSPSACFHVYEHYEKKRLSDMQVITLKQNVFREERDWKLFGKMRDYHVREIVFIGDMDFVGNMRKSVIEKTRRLANKIFVDYQIQLATDSFILPEMKKYQKVQLIKKSKYEMTVKCRLQSLAIASFNIHENAFTKPFQIEVNNVDNPVSGCVGFGLERWAFAFLYQYGYKLDAWPEYIKERI